MKGNANTCRCAAASRQEAPPRAWGVGVYLTAGAKVINKMLQQVATWDPHCNNNGNTVNGLLARTTASSAACTGAAIACLPATGAHAVACWKVIAFH
jgi:hypothetical protein